MTHQVLRQRRRIFVFAICAMLATSIHFGAGLHAIVAAIGAFAVALGLLVYRADQRHLVECLALALLIVAPVPVPAYAYPVAVSLVALGLARLIYGDGQKYLPIRLSLVSEHSAIVEGTRRSAWNALVPSASHPEDYWSGRLLDFNRDHLDPDTVYLSFLTPDDAVHEMTLSFLDNEAPAYCRFLLETERARVEDDILVTIRLTDMGDGTCLIESRLSQDDLPLGTALARWFDDDFGDELDGYAKTYRKRMSWNILRQALPSRQAAMNKGAAEV